MSLTIYNNNKEIEDFVNRKAQDATPFSREELVRVNQYSGFGGLWKFDDQLKKERGLYEYYTPMPLIEKMVGLAYEYGYNGGKVLEPSAGIGRFLHYFSPSTKVTAYEPDLTSYLIAKANFPTFNIINSTFNEVFVDRQGKVQSFDKDYDLVIGNPPYGIFKGRYTTSEKKATNATNYVEYFISRGLDMLKTGGVLVYVIPSNFIQGGFNKAKESIYNKATLQVAYRLPRNIFKATDIQTDIVVFTKKRIND